MGNDLFATGLLLSDTDFRQFVDYGNLTGLDMAVYKTAMSIIHIWTLMSTWRRVFPSA